jgi:secondary thiamine-phosphate synthase enzyme
LTHQEAFAILTEGRGMTQITSRVAEIVGRGNIATGIAHVFVRHTSCSLVITENADPAVRRDLETPAQRWAPDGDPAYLHQTEGTDDMAAHGRSVLTSSSVSLPIGQGELLLGTWQGIYLWEHRTAKQSREIIVTVVS